MINPQDYTDEVICHSMSIGPFIDKSWNASCLAIRVLFKPSFHPEACITLTLCGGVARLEVVVLAEHLRLQEYACRLPAYRHDSEITPIQFNRICQLHQIAISDTHSQRFCTIADGMGMSCAWKDAEQCHVLDWKGTTYRTMIDYVKELIELTWNNTINSGIRNGIADCGRYVGLKYMIETEPPKPELFRIGVFGIPDDVNEFYSALRTQQKMN